MFELAGFPQAFSARQGFDEVLGLALSREAGGGGQDGLVAGVEGGAEQEDGGDAADDLGEVFGFVLVEGAAEEGEFAVAEPLFENLVAAESVVPDVDRDGGPEGRAVEVDVDAGFSEEGVGLLEGMRWPSIKLDKGRRR